MLDEEKQTAIGQRIKDKREDRDMTQQSLGERIGLGKAAISKIESGKQMMTADHIIGIADTLKIRTDYILGLDNIPDKETEHLIAGIKMFSEMSTTKAHTIKNKATYNSEDFVFQTDKDYLMLTGSKSLFSLIRKIAKIQIAKARLSKEEYNNRITTAKESFNQSRGKGQNESYFLISGKQMDEIIKSTVKNEMFLKAVLKEIDDTTDLEE